MSKRYQSIQQTRRELKQFIGQWPPTQLMEDLKHINDPREVSLRVAQALFEKINSFYTRRGHE